MHICYTLFESVFFQQRMLQGEVEVGWLQMSFIRQLQMEKNENWSDLECTVGHIHCNLFERGLRFYIHFQTSNKISRLR